LPAASPRDDRPAKPEARLRCAPPSFRLGRRADRALTFKLDQSVGADQKVVAVPLEHRERLFTSAEALKGQREVGKRPFVEIGRSREKPFRSLLKFAQFHCEPCPIDCSWDGASAIEHIDQQSQATVVWVSRSDDAKMIARDHCPDRFREGT
ncbi:MAG: hypothetical protein NXI35_38490, partial [bacterium]|nr:hypothetical protein [bacterium]